MSFNLGEVLVNAILPIVENVGKEKLIELLQKLHDKNATTYKQALIALYPIIDVQLEGVTSETKTKIDDAFVLALKQAIEESALKNSVGLPNLDAGTAGD